jgi:hypothetical protein
MNGLEIFAKVQSNKKRIEDLMDNCVFVLNPEIAKLEQENEELQSICQHEFVNGSCKFCDKEEE